MFKNIATKVGAGTAIAILSVAGFAAFAPGTASANNACEDFIRIMTYYDEIGDRATADAMYHHLQDDGCI
jgi:hypothetical protein